MNEIRLTRGANLPAMLARGEDVRALEQFLVVIRLVALDPVEDVFEADHEESKITDSGQHAVSCRAKSRHPLPKHDDRAVRGDPSTTLGMTRPLSGEVLPEARNPPKHPSAFCLLPSAFLLCSASCSSVL